MITEIEGIVLSEVDYKETSKIINVLTNDGVIGIMCSGAKKMKSPLNNVSKLSYGTFHLNYKHAKMPYLIELDIKNSFKEIRKDIEKISYAIYLLELTYQVYRHEEKNSSKLYNLLLNALLKINDNFDSLVITNIVELQYLDFLGIKPSIDKCVSCGSTDNIITLSSYKGGYICRDCYNHEPLVSNKTLKLVRMFYYVDISKISKLDISDPVKEEINKFIDDYYDRYSGLYLKSKDFIKTLNKVGA